LKNQPRIYTDNHGFESSTKHQAPFIIASIRVSSVFHPWLKRIGENQPRIYTDFHGFEPRSSNHCFPYPCFIGVASVAKEYWKNRATDIHGFSRIRTTSQEVSLTAPPVIPQWQPMESLSSQQ
jgi:hypothetical protein